MYRHRVSVNIRDFCRFRMMIELIENAYGNSFFRVFLFVSYVANRHIIFYQSVTFPFYSIVMSQVNRRRMMVETS